MKALFWYVEKDSGPFELNREKDGPGLASVMVDRYLRWNKTSVYPAVSD